MFCRLNVNVAQFLQCFCRAGWVWGRGPVGGTGGYQVVTGDTLADTLSRTCKLLPTLHQYCFFCAAIPSAAQKPFAAREQEKELLFLQRRVVSGTYNWLVVITNYKENWKHIWLIFASEKKRNRLKRLNLFSNKTRRLQLFDANFFICAHNSNKTSSQPTTQLRLASIFFRSSADEAAFDEK